VACNIAILNGAIHSSFRNGYIQFIISLLHTTRGKFILDVGLYTVSNKFCSIF